MEELISEMTAAEWLKKIRAEYTGDNIGSYLYFKYLKEMIDKIKNREDCF